MKWVIRIVGVIAGLLLLSVAVLFAMSQRDAAKHINASIEINAPRERVWTALTEPEKLKQWITWLVEVRQDGNQRVYVMRDENNGGQLMEIRSSVLESSAPQHLRFTMSAPQEGFDGDHTYELADAGSGRTKVSCTGSYQFSAWVVKLMSPLFMPMAEKKLAGDLARLKAIVEAEK